MKAILLLSTLVSFINCAPLYGENGGYRGYASYTPPKNDIRKSLKRAEFPDEESLDTSAGSPEFSKKPSKSTEDASEYDSVSLPKQYDVLDYANINKHGYGGNAVLEDNPSSPYDRATLYGELTGGYKIADIYRKHYRDSNNDKQHNLNDKHTSYFPQSYEYGYAIKDKHGNAQHKHETSDDNGNVKGSYGFMDEHGLYRSVHYVADKDGFRAVVKTNEPGTQSKNPADVHIDSEES